jgi:lipopolysaccharide export LptBFGC system permease protein LptF
MKTLRLYLLRETLATLAMTVVVFTGILLLGNLLKDVLVLVVSQKASLVVVAKAVAMLIPYVLAFSLPMGLLCASLLVFGRLSADSELTAMRASGISVAALAVPMVALAILLSGLCFWVNLDLAPRCRVAFKKVMFEALTESTRSIPEGQYLSEGGFTYYVGSVRGDVLKDIEIYQSNSKTQQWMRAESGRLARDPDKGTITVTLTDWWVTQVTETNFYSGQYLGDYTLPTFRPKLAQNPTDFGLSNMTFSELRAKLLELQAQMKQELAGKIDALTPEQRQKVERERRDFTGRIRVQMHRMASFSFACVGFTMIGIPLGIRAHRRETSAGIAIALGLVLLYYSFFVLGQSLSPGSWLSPSLVLWAPNFLFQAIGGWLIWRADSGPR